MDSFGVEYTRDDLTELSQAFIKGVRRGAKSSPVAQLTVQDTPMGGGGILISATPRPTKTKAQSKTSLGDIKNAVQKGRDEARPKLDELTGDKAISGKIQGGIQYAHGEAGGPITTLGTEKGAEAIEKISSREVSQNLKKYIKDEHLFYQTFKVS